MIEALHYVGRPSHVFPIYVFLFVYMPTCHAHKVPPSLHEPVLEMQRMWHERFGNWICFRLQGRGGRHLVCWVP
jgi:hypothetical protein